MGSVVERRKHTRIGCNASLDYSLFVLESRNIKSVQSNARGVDVSNDGVGFCTGYPLEPGHILKLRKDDGTEQTAMVRWVGEKDKKYRVGVLLY